MARLRSKSVTILNPQSSVVLGDDRNQPIEWWDVPQKIGQFKPKDEHLR